MSILHPKVKDNKVGLSDLRDYPVNGIHHHHMVLANYCKHREVPEQEAVALLYQKFYASHQRRSLQPNEIERAVATAYRSGSRISFKKMGKEVIVQQVFTKTSEGSLWNNEMPLPNSKVKPQFICKAIKLTPWALEDMFEDSPLRVCDCKPSEILQMLYDPNDLLCCGSVSNFNTRTARDWLSASEIGEQIVPNPSRLAVGISKSGKPSAHCRDATGQRKYIVIESDEGNQSFDDKASIIRYLRDEVRAELKMVVHSAGKSLHAWFKSSGNHHTDWEFMQLACKLGADRRMWLPEQLARTPNAIRGKSNLRQKCLYFDPS